MLGTGCTSVPAGFPNLRALFHPLPEHSNQTCVCRHMHIRTNLYLTRPGPPVFAYAGICKACPVCTGLGWPHPHVLLDPWNIVSIVLLVLLCMSLRMSAYVYHPPLPAFPHPVSFWSVPHSPLLPSKPGFGRRFGPGNRRDSASGAGRLPSGFNSFQMQSYVFAYVVIRILDGLEHVGILR